MEKEVLHVGQTDARINVKVDYEDGSQISLAELQAAQGVEIMYAYRNYDGDNVAQAIWTATGEYEDDGVYIYYTFSGHEVPEADRLVGRAKITDMDGKISYGREFTIQVLPSSIVF